MMLCGVDVGGTFTDFVLYDPGAADMLVHKVVTTPEDPLASVIAGIGQLCTAAGIQPSDIDVVAHGTTVATDTVANWTGARTGLVTTKGFRDIVHIGRHQRPHAFSLMQDIPWQATPLVARRYRRVVRERIGPGGVVLEPLDESEMRLVARSLRDAGVEAIAVCFLFAFANPRHERRAAEIIAEEVPGVFVTTSADVVSRFREFERFTTTMLNAFAGPATTAYIDDLRSRLAELGVDAELWLMGSSGGVVSPPVAARHPVSLLISGPAAGVVGGVAVAERLARKQLITFDVGGTSAGVAIVTESGLPTVSARAVDRWVPVHRADARRSCDRVGGCVPSPCRQRRGVSCRSPERRRVSWTGVLRARRARGNCYRCQRGPWPLAPGSVHGWRLAAGPRRGGRRGGTDRRPAWGKRA